MSGFEIAGVVLGGFPILCDAAKDLKGILKKAKSWWQFEAAFDNFTSAIETQEVAYSQVLQRLLGPLDISDSEYESLLRNPQSTLWHDASVQYGLRQRLLGSEHRWFMSNLGDLNEAIVDLQKLLPLDQLYHLDSTSIESEIYRLQTSFSSEKDRLLERITNINDELHTFFDRASGVTRQAVQKLNFSFTDLHNQALTFYECLSQQWHCCCSIDHTVGITINPTTLKPIKRANLGFFDVLFETETKRKQLKLHIESFVATESKPDSLVEQPTPTINIEAVGDMREQMIIKKQIQSVSITASEKSVAALAFTTLSISGPPCSAPPRRSILKRMSRKLQKPRPAPVSNPAPSLHKSVSNGSSISSLNRSVSGTTVVLTDNSSLSTAPESETPTSSICTLDASKVRFGDAATKPTSTVPNDNTETGNPVDICKLATETKTSESHRNILPVSAGKRIILQPESLDQSPLEPQSIDAFLRATAMRYNRLYIGLRFALTLLSLATSAWVPTEPAKTDIFLISPGAASDKKAQTQPLGPYFARSARDICTTTSAKHTKTWNAKTSLLLLGVVLLELFNGDTLENQPSWAESLGPDGQPNEMTTFLSAWLWMNTTQNTMKAWIGEDLGGALYEAIRKCLCFDFGRDDDYGDTRFAEVVYREVVVPLEKCCPLK
ncbi:uncharacterized protein CTRU02_207536 [Colletotrichum truncatum]|uniref:Uncharacterized protein n=1 Tax=Colletotrichum truncatum TaxID=5467 RepID=A0ACC3Z138_COLTU|nr:uncharacterized protein CTRU02_00835 [Colletotrichum truncatum]KAF6800430.1 hypothetical protein CTRU02_00835 [Colletotrichum truncatum]